MKDRAKSEARPLRGGYLASMTGSAALAAVCAVAVACGYGEVAPAVRTSPTASAAATSLGTRVAKVAAAGDIACPTAESKPGCRAADTALLVKRLNPSLVLALGDLSYDTGTPAEFTNGYAPTWGAFRSKTFPVPGNHEYYTSGATGYKAWWGSIATPSGTTWHSKTIGNWLILGIDSNCGPIGGCGDTTEQVKWLTAKLKTAPKCVLAIWHHPRRSSGPHGDTEVMQPIWAKLAAAKADLVLSGHDHAYERFGPLDANANPAKSGVRQFVVGTGGKAPYPLGTPHPGSVASVQGVDGVLELDLRTNGYSWRFVGTDDKARDPGSATCRT